MRFHARQLATAWLTVATASAPAKDVPLLARTVSVELYAGGARLTATDRVAILTGWVPAVDDAYEPEPDLDEAPILRAVLADVDHRAAGLMGYARQLTADDKDLGDSGLDLRLTIGLDRPDLDEGRFPGMETRYAVLELPDTERVWLPIVDGDFPEWRALLASFTARRTNAVAFSGELVLGRLAKVAKLLGGPVRVMFGGTDKAARIEADSPALELGVVGLVMPTRVEWPELEPAPAEEPDVDEEPIGGMP